MNHIKDFFIYGTAFLWIILIINIPYSGRSINTIEAKKINKIKGYSKKIILKGKGYGVLENEKTIKLNEEASERNQDENTYTINNRSSGGAEGYVNLHIVHEDDGSLSVYYLDPSTEDYVIDEVEIRVMNLGDDYEDDSPVWDQTKNYNGTGTYLRYNIYGLEAGVEYDIYILEWISSTSWFYSWTTVAPEKVLPVPTNIGYNQSTRQLYADSPYKVGFEWGEVSEASSRFNDYTYAQRNYFYNVSLNTSEYSNWRYWAAESYYFRKFTKSNVTYRTVFNPSAVSNQTTLNNVVNNVLGEINTIISGSGITLSRTTSTSADITVEFGTGAELGFDEYSYGTWENEDTNGELTWGYVKMRTDLPYNITLHALARQELAQVLGPGNDTDDDPYNIFFEVAWSGHTFYTNDDEQVIKMHYCENLPVNANSGEIARLINCIAIDGDSIGSTKTINLEPNYLKPNTEYKFRVFAVRNAGLYADEYSSNSDWQYFTTPGFTWTYAGYQGGLLILGPNKISGFGFYLTAAEWRNLQDAINSVRWDHNLSMFSFFEGYNGDNSFTIPHSGMNLYAYMFNQCVNAIQPLNPPISPPARVSVGDNISAAGLNRLKDSINSVT